MRNVAQDPLEMMCVRLCYQLPFSVSLKANVLRLMPRAPTQAGKRLTSRTVLLCLILRPAYVQRLSSDADTYPCTVDMDVHEYYST